MTTALQATAFGLEIQERLLTEFRRAAEWAPAYRVLLEERGVRAAQVRDIESFTRVCPLLSKANTFDRFPLAQLSVGALAEVGELMTSSGHGGRFSYGVISRKEASAGASFTDAALEATFHVSSRQTLFINCLPMGVIFSSNCMTVATTSVREDVVLALVEAVDNEYEQIILAGAPLFMKRLTDYAADRGVDWQRHRARLMLGGEFSGEHAREYFARCMGLTGDDLDQGAIMSSFGVGELGLHLCFETPPTVALRRAAAVNPIFARDLFGGVAGTGTALLPMILSFDDRRTFIEAVEPDCDGYGRLAISMLDPDRSVPLLRYQTGDIVRLLERDHVNAACRRHGVHSGGDRVPATLVALRGREADELPNGSHVNFYNDALYADHRLARLLTGAFRLIFSGRRCTLHVQLVRGQTPSPTVEQDLLGLFNADVRPARLVLWPYAEFPFGMGLDYQRKFSHYVPGEA